MQVRDCGVGGDDLRGIRPGDVYPRVDLVRIWTARVVDLGVEARAAEALGDAGRAARRLGPLKDPLAAACLHRRGLVHLRQLSELRVDRGALLLDLRVLILELRGQL